MDEEVSDHSSGSNTPRSSPVRDYPVPVRGRGRRASQGRTGPGRARARGGQRDRLIRGRGRGGRRGRVVYGPHLPNRAELAQIRRQERDEHIRERISQLPEEGLRDFAMKVCEKKHPAFVFDILNENSQNQMGYHPQPGGEQPNWCRCNKCREMPTEDEKLCCGQVPINCYSTLPDFDLVVLDQLVLAVAQNYREDVLAAAPDDDYNRGKRHAAYRQFILWKHGHMGAGNRRVIPSCCVWKIRDKYPDSFGNYRGFVGGRLG